MEICAFDGNLTRDPEIRFIDSNGRKVAVANFTVAVNDFFTRNNGEKDKITTFIPCEAWDSGAEAIGKYFVKGDPILVEGAIRSDNWEKDGVKHSRLKIRVKTFKKLNRAQPRTPTAEPAQDPSELVEFN